MTQHDASVERNQPSVVMLRDSPEHDAVLTDCPNASPNSLTNEPKLHARHILVCLDGSTFAEACIPHAVSLAKTFKGAMTLLHIIPSPHADSSPQANDALAWEISRQEAQAYLEHLAERVTQSLGRSVNVRLEQGRPGERIVDLARELAVSLTVLTSRGEGGGPGRTLGTTAQLVLALVHSSVFIVHPSLVAADDVTTKCILVPLDGSLRTESVLPAVARIARDNASEVLLVHIVQEPLPSALLTVEDMELSRKLAGRLELGARHYLETLQQQLASEVAAVRTRVVRHQNPQQCLLNISKGEHADLIVLTAHGCGCDSALSFGGVAAYLISHSTTRLLVLQDLPASELHHEQLAEATQQAAPSLRASYAPAEV